MVTMNNLRGFAAPALAIALVHATSTAALAATVTATFDLASATPTIVALPGQTAVFTADTGIKFSAVGGAIGTVGGPIADADIRSAPLGAGVNGDAVIVNGEYFFFSDPTTSDGTPLAGRWTAFTVVGNAPTLPSFDLKIVDAISVDSAAGFFSIASAEFLTPKRFTIDLLGDNAWAFTRSGFDGAFTISSLEYTYDSADVPPIPLPAAAWLLLGGLGALGAFGASARGRQG